jgi:hypothetical protein
LVDHSEYRVKWEFGEPGIYPLGSWLECTIVIEAWRAVAAQACGAVLTGECGHASYAILVK